MVYLWELLDTMMTRMILQWLVAIVWVLVTIFPWATGSWAAIGDVNYISDVLSVPLRSGPSNAHRIIHRGLPSGTRLTIMTIDEEAGFTQVRTDNGTEGWVRSQYLVAVPIARARLETAQRRLQKIQAELDKERKARTSLDSEFKTAQGKNRSLNNRTEAMEKELAEIKRISANSINQHSRNVELTNQNERLHNEVADLSETVRDLEENVQREGLLIGGGLVLLGLLLGVMIKARPRQTSTGYSRYK